MSSWAEAALVADRVLAEPPRWCQRRSYGGVFGASAVATAVLHRAVGRLGRGVDWSSRVVSSINSVAILCLYRHELGSPYDAVLRNRCERDLAMVALVGYLVVDAVLSTRELVRRRRRLAGTYGDPLVLAHHLIIVVAFCVGIVARLATTYMAALLLNELSTPFVNIHALIRRGWTVRPPTVERLYVLNAAALVSTYLLSRVVWTARVVAHAAFAWASLWRVGLLVGGYRLYVLVFLSALLLGHLAINLLWFAIILRKLTSHYYYYYDAKRQKAL
ncbi:hypothetical protein CTAYLR_004299 [Chrysophaeum taylorii]|uniref:TLC domain-containing protein n=1 Tax=Chrysophaeum taylorii TaxID=2483200 RepID=A0AAD7XIU7_9STRA|nr:hypothetical protein CTAYLR_004299 [Chrysophaeum taylorii]